MKNVRFSRIEVGLKREKRKVSALSRLVEAYKEPQTQAATSGIHEHFANKK